MSTLLHDLRHAVRLLRRQRSFALAAIGTIALAIAANTAIFSLVYGVLLRPLPLPAPDRLVRIEERHEARRLNLTGATFTDVEARGASFDGVAAYRLMSPGLAAGGAPEQVMSAEVSPGYFTVIGAPAALGRVFADRDFAMPVPRAVIVSDGVWRRLLGGASGVIGTHVTVDAEPLEVIGVMPRGLDAPGSPDIWLPRPSSSPLLRNRRAHLYTVIARLAAGRSVTVAREELSALAPSIVRDSGGANPGMTLVATPLQARQVEGVRPALLVLWIAAGVLLLIAAANIANLLLMQGSARARELSIRTALGAGRARLARQLAAETALLGAIGGTLGTLIGAWSVPALRAALPAAVPRGDALVIDLPVVLFGAGASIVATILFGIVPALRASARRPADALRDRAGGDARQGGLRRALVAAEVALTVVLLAAAGLLARSFYSVMHVSPGFDAAHVLTVSLSPLAARYPDARAQDAFYARVLDRFHTVPSVRAAAVTGALPLTGGPATTMVPARTTAREELSADVVTVTPEFFAALRIPVLRGRVFTERDRAGAPPVLVLNEAAVRRFWPEGTDPLGAKVTMKDWGDPYLAEVVGVVADVHQHGLETDAVPAAYYPLAQFPEATLSHTIVVRTDDAPRALTGTARALVWAVDRDQPVARVRPLEDVLAAAVAERRFNLLLIGGFAASALLLAAIGVYGIVGFAVGQRTREIGVRMALGAGRLDVARTAATQGLVPIGVGLALGLAGALAATRWLQSLLFGVVATDPLTLAGVCSVVVLTALAASIPPVRRALRIDPMTALRAE